MALSFVLDEHLRGRLWTAMQRHNLHGNFPIDAVRIGDGDDLPLSITDPVLLAWAANVGRIIVSEDRRTLPKHLESFIAIGNDSPGIILIRPGQTLPDIDESLVLIAYAGEASDFANRVTWIP